MTLLGLIIFILVVAGIIWIWNRYRKRSALGHFIETVEQYQKQAIEDYGEVLVAKAKVIDPLESTTPAPRMGSGPMAYTQRLPEVLEKLKKRVLSITVGRYKIEDPGAIAYLDVGIDRGLQYLAAGKDPDTIAAQYDPGQNNDLLLEAARALMEYPHLEPMKKILVAQFIVNKTHDGNELDVIYNYITSVAMDRRYSALVRGEAADILNLSNSRRYMKIARQALELLRQEEDVQRRELRTPAGGQLSITAQQTPAEARPRPPTGAPAGSRITAIPHRVGDPGGIAWRREYGERNDLFIIPPLVGRGGGQDLDLQRVLLEAAQPTPRVPKTERTVYSDSQNTHNTEINNSVLEAAHRLVSTYRPQGILSLDHALLENLAPMQRTKVDAAIHRLMTDSSTFKHGTSLYSIYQSLLHFIAQSPHKQDLSQRLIQELIDMSGMCATGHIARLVSVIQGYTEDDNLRIKIDISDEVYGKVKHLADRAIAGDENSDELVQDLSSPEKIQICAFLSDQASKWKQDLFEEYKGIATREKVNEEIAKALNKYTNTTGKFG